jgi:DNA-binding response OmpR family regulator
MKKKILIIEDEKDLRFFIVRALKEEGFEIIEAIDGEEGIEKAKKEKPDLILLDLLLPGISGYEVLARIKKDPEMEMIPVLILSNLGQQEEIEKGLKLGAVDYLIKANFTLDEIVERIKKIIYSPK